MAKYEIIHVADKWVICVEQIRLISFDRKWKAMKTMYAAEKLLDSYLQRAKPLGLGVKPLAAATPNRHDTRPYSPALVRGRKNESRAVRSGLERPGV
jgi:hypothetical protein